MSRQRIDWAHHRETWINRNLNGATYALKQLARDEDLSYGVLTRKAREQGWRQQLEVRCAELRDRVSEEVRERTAVDQVEARLEHARLADLIEPVKEPAAFTTSSVLLLDLRASVAGGAERYQKVSPVSFQTSEVQSGPEHRPAVRAFVEKREPRFRAR